MKKNIQMESYLKDLANYNIWANELLIRLSKENINLIEKETLSSFSTIRSTLAHIRFAESLWLSRLKREAIITKPTFDGTNEALLEDLLVHSKEFFDFVNGKDNTFFDASNDYDNPKGVPYNEKNGAIILHVLNHSSYHRGQVVTMLRTLGATKMTSMDYITYLRGKSKI
jgi:uncharacterized damage-inducible protein DinB